MNTEEDQYRHECEVRHIAKWSLTDRRAFLAEVEKHRGVDAANRIRASLIEIWDKKDNKK